MMHSSDQPPHSQPQPSEFRVRITPARANSPWRAEVVCPGGDGPLPFEHPEDFVAYLRRHWFPSGLR